MKKTTIAVSVENYDKLGKLCKKGESFNDAITKLFAKREVKK